MDEGFGHPNYSLQLIYKASRDGFKAVDFHRKCDGKENTISIIESGYGNIFGGFTSIAWQSKGDWKHDSKAWVFSLTHKTVHRLC